MSDLTFLLCTERSGSNLITAILDSHPEIYAPRPIHLIGIWQEVWQYGDLSRDSNWNALIRHLPTQIKQTVGYLDSEFTPEEFDKNCERTFSSIYRYIYEKGASLKGKRHIFIKENFLHKHMAKLLGSFPDARFVFQVRDPRDFIASCKSGGMYQDLVHGLDIWRDDQAASLALARSLPPGRIFMQRYEDLVQKPEVVLRALCAFLGVDYVPSMLKFNETAASKEASQRTQYWKNLAKPILSDNVSKYEQVLSPMAVRLTEEKVGDLMELFGYQRKTAPTGPLGRLLLQLIDRDCVHDFDQRRPVPPRRSPLLRQLTKWRFRTTMPKEERALRSNASQEREAARKAGLASADAVIHYAYDAPETEREAPVHARPVQS